MINVYEVNFDGLVGLTHNYSGLSPDNKASSSNKGLVSHPKKAALQGLEKMKFLMDKGLIQGVLPPHERPYLRLLEDKGYSGSPIEMIREAFEKDPVLLSNASSSAFMWAANAATVTPSRDAFKWKVCFTAANLKTQVHRRIEGAHTYAILKEIFYDDQCFKVNRPAPLDAHFFDEGAANHTRLCPNHRDKGLHLFVYGRSFLYGETQPKKYVARQNFEASDLVAQTHGIEKNQCIFIQQNPDAIDAGVFHNDVICVGNENVLFLHEKAFYNQEKAISRIKEQYLSLFDEEITIIEVKDTEISLDKAIKTYLFNSQLVTLPNNQMLLLTPKECEDDHDVRNYLNKLLSSGNTRIKEVKSINIRESMLNGGGPACLRLRVLLTERELAAIRGRVILNQSLYEDLKTWILEYYQDEFVLEDLTNPDLLENNKIAIEKLWDILEFKPYTSYDRSF